MDAGAREKLKAELAATRDDLNRQAGELEKHAAKLDPYKHEEGDVKAFLESEARTLREEARKLGSQWTDLVEDELRDDDRGGLDP